MTQKDHVVALQRAVDIAGNQVALAAKLREYFRLNPTTNRKVATVSQQTISYWLRSGALLDAIWWPAFEFATDSGVTRRDLRPDVFSRDHAA